MNTNALSVTNDTSMKSKTYKIDIDKSEMSQTYSQSKNITTEKSPSRNDDKKNTSTNNLSNLELTQENASRDKKNRNRSPSVNNKSRSNNLVQSKKKMKKKVTFKEKNFLDIVMVESWKKYNIDMTHSDPINEETTRCRCLIF